MANILEIYRVNPSMYLVNPTNPGKPDFLIFPTSLFHPAGHALELGP